MLALLQMAQAHRLEKGRVWQDVSRNMFPECERILMRY